MAEKKAKRPRLTSVRGLLKYPRLTVPDTKFNKDGEYSTKLLLEPDAPKVAEFLKKLDEETDKAFTAMKAEHKKFSKVMTRTPTYHMELDKEGDETGKIELGFSMPAKVTAKKGANIGKTFEFKPALFDAFGKPIDKELRIGGGTEAKVSFEFWPYFAPNDKKAGLTKRLVAVQIIGLVEWSNQQDAGDYGFEAEEDGFSSTEAESTSGSDDAEDDDEDESGDKDDAQSGSDF